MKKKVLKKIDEKVDSLLIEWLKSILSEDDRDKITKENFKNFLPKDKYFVAQKTIRLSFYTSRWARQNIKKLMRKGKFLDTVTLEDLKCSLKTLTKNSQLKIL